MLTRSALPGYPVEAAETLRHGSGGPPQLHTVSHSSDHGWPYAALPSCHCGQVNGEGMAGVNVDFKASAGLHDKLALDDAGING